MSEQAFEVISDGEEELEDEFDDQLENGGIRKNLLDEFAESIDKTQANDARTNGREFMKVFLRIRPFTEEEIESKENKECMEINGEKAILLNAPRDSFTFKNEKRGREVTHRFSFSRVFGSETTQKTFFDDTSLSLVKDFMDGQNCLVFTYGITNSGKTYTIQGTPKDGGILPRTLDVLFNSIQSKHYNRMNLKPRYFCDVIKINEKQEQMEGALRNGLMMSLNKEYFDLDSFLQLEESNEFSRGSIAEESALQDDEIIDTEINNCDNEDVSRVSDDTVINVDAQGPVKFSVWISFAEIYNELICDLLEPCPDNKGKKRTTLKLGDDKNGNPYIKGLREVCVSSADEAYKVLRVGKKNQRIASTRQNQFSSRSHCIFSIKILRVVDVENPHAARVSRLSFVDLAGSERYTKTHSKGDRLKEAGNINTSLMTLGKCLESLRYNQLHTNHPQIIPFRESKLTRLFQGFFCGKGKASMIVNINQCASTFDETYHALKFSAIAKQVTTKVSKPVDMGPPAIEKSFRPSFAFPTPSKVPRMSIAWENGALSTPAVAVEEGGDNTAQSYQQQLENLVRVFQEQLIEEKTSKAKLEVKIREEVCSEMAEQLVAIESAYSERIQEEVSAVEEKCDRRIELLAKSIKKTRKRARIEKQEDEVEELVPSLKLHAEREKVEELTAKLNGAETHVESMRVALDDDEKRFKAQEEVMADLQSALETSTKELEIARIQLDKRDQMLNDKDEIIEQLQRKLDEQNDNILLKSENQETMSKLARNLEKDLKKRDENLEEKNEVIRMLERKLEDGERLFQQKSDVLAQSKEIADKFERRLAEKDAIISAKLSSLETNNAVVKTLEENLKEEEAKVNKMSVALKRNEECMENLEKTLQERDEMITEQRESLEKKDVLVKKLERELQEHRVALDSNESFLKQLNSQVKQLTCDLNNAKKQEKENDGTPKRGGLESALVSKISNLREQLLSRDELMKELVQSLEETRAQVEIEKGDLAMVCKELKNKIVLLEEELAVQKILEQDDHTIDSLKEELKQIEVEKVNAKEQVEMNSFEKEEVQCALDAANDRAARLQQDAECLKKSLCESNEKAASLEKLLEDKSAELAKLQAEMTDIDAKLQQDAESLKKSLCESNEKAASLEKLLEDKGAELAMLQAEMADIDQEAAQKKISELEKQLEKQQSKVTEMQAELQKLGQMQTENTNAQELIANANRSRLNEKNDEVERLQKQLQDGNQQIDHLEQKLKMAEETIEDLAAKGVTQDSMMNAEHDKTTVSALEKQLESTTRALDKKNSQLIARNNVLKRLEFSLSEKEAKIVDLEKGTKTPNTPARDLRSKEEIKTLRRRVIQADKEVEEMKQKAQEYQAKIKEITEHLEERNNKLSQAQGKYEEAEKRMAEMEKERSESHQANATMEEKLQANEKKLELYGLQLEENKEATKEVEKLKEEIMKSRTQQQEKVIELEKVRAKAELLEKAMQDAKLERSDKAKENEEKLMSMVEKTQTAEACVTNTSEKLKMLEETTQLEANKLREEIQEKEQIINQKIQEIETTKKIMSTSEQEKSEELDKVWKTLVELQTVIKKRGETIDDLETQLSRVEARHSREKATLENTVAKMKEVMETKGGDTKKQVSQIAELENQLQEIRERNVVLSSDSNHHEKDMDAIKKVLEVQDGVMEEQQEALNERQNEIESLVEENNNLLKCRNLKDSKTESANAEIRRLEGTLSVYVEEKEKLEKELAGMRKNGESFEISKVERSRDFEKEKSDILVKLEQKEGNITKLKTQLKGEKSEAAKEKKALLQKVKEKEAELHKTNERLQDVEGEKREYEGLCQLKDEDVRIANLAKDQMLTAMKEALTVASAKKEQFETKIEAVKRELTEELTEKYEKEIKKLKEDNVEKTVEKEIIKTKPPISEEKATYKGQEAINTKPPIDEKKGTSKGQEAKNKIPEKRCKTRKDKDKNDSTMSDGKNTSSEAITSQDSDYVKELKDEPLPEGRIEIDATPITSGRKRTARQTASKSTAKKRRSSDLPLSEVKTQLSSRKARKVVEVSEDEFTPVSVNQKSRSEVTTSKRKTKANSSSSTSSARKTRPSAKPLSPMNEAQCFEKQPSIKKKRFLGKLFSSSANEDENTPPHKKGRKLRKKDISVPMDSPFIAEVNSVPGSAKGKASNIITRQLRSRAIKF